MRNKKIVRLTEGQLHRVISESVNRVLLEWEKGAPADSDIHYQAWANEFDAENNGQGVDRTAFHGDTRRNYKLRNTDNGWRNFHNISAAKGGGINNLSYSRTGNGGNNNGQLESIIDELAEYIGSTPDEIKKLLGNLR